VLKFEFAAEVGGLFEAEVEGDFLDGFTGKEQRASGVQALLIEPLAGRHAKLAPELALELPGGKFAQPGQGTGIVIRLNRQFFDGLSSSHHIYQRNQAFLWR